MKKLIYIKITKSLCAIFLIMGVLFFSYPVTVFAEETEETTAEETTTAVPESTVDPDDNNNAYRYNLEIEFGTLNFYYDWGKWDTEYCQYFANESSKNPSIDTKEKNDEWQQQNQDDTKQLPGWYGFDGVANKISFVNTSTIDSSLWVKFDFHNNPYYEGDNMEKFPDLKFENLDFSYYDAQGTELPGEANSMIMEIPKSIPNDDITEGAPEYISTDVFVHISGIPYLNETDKDENSIMFHSSAPTHIGFLTVTVGLNGADLIPSSAYIVEYPSEGPLEETTAETIAESTEETTAETTAESTEETTAETTAESAEETTAETTAESAEETTAETTVESPEETTAETTAESTEETTAETTAESAEETTAETIADTSSESESKEEKTSQAPLDGEITE